MEDMMDIRNFQFATILTSLVDVQLTHRQLQEYEIIKMTIMNIGEEATKNDGDDPKMFTQEMGALTLLLMASKWVSDTDLMVVE